MRFIVPAAVALALLSFQAQAQSSGAAPAAGQAPTAVAPATSAAPATPSTSTSKKKHHQSLQQRFDAANTTHDGHLTKDQAAAAKWPYVVNNFTGIDKDKKGYVTVDEIRGFAQAHHKKHTTTQAKASTPSPAKTPAPAAAAAPAPAGASSNNE
jgi:hypothetical protein